MSSPFLELKNISKSFPGVQALDNVCLEVKKGEVLGLIGSNGAGKSTLMNILGGILQKDKGVIRIDGNEVNFSEPLDATQNGISFVHQELLVFPTLSVLENMLIGGFPKNKFHLIDFNKSKAQCDQILKNLKCSFSATDLVKNLGAGDKQMIEIARALLGNPKIIIFDEPTSSLSKREKEKLFAVINTLRKESVAIIYITHFLDEIFKICDHAVVLRNGTTVGGGKISDLTYERVVRYMIGDRDTEKSFHKQEISRNDQVMLTVANLNREGVLNNIAFSLKKGEVVGLWGLMGSGRSELMRAVIGLDKSDSCQIQVEVESRLQACKPRQLHKRVGYISENRREDGLMLPLSVVQNMSLANLKGYFYKLFPFFINDKREKKVAETFIADLKIKISNLKQTVATLSGGNQQKVILARWLQKQPKVYFMDEPTRGLDVGAKGEIYNIINDLTNQGASVLVVSSDIEEIMAISDRFLVLCKGKIIAEFSHEVSKEKLMLAATGTLEAD